MQPTPSRKCRTGIPDIDREIYLCLDDEDLLNACQVDTYAVLLCNEEFWNLRIQRIYGVDLTKYRENNAYLEVYKILREHKGDSKKELKKSAERGYLPLVKRIVETTFINDYTYENYTMISAVKGGRLDVIEYLVKVGSNNQEQLTNILLVAVRLRRTHIVKYLIEGSDAYTHDHYKELIIGAALMGYLDILKYLIEKVDVHAMPDTAITAAVTDGHIEVVKYLIEEAEYHVPLFTQEYHMYLAQKHGYIELKKYLEKIYA